MLDSELALLSRPYGWQELDARKFRLVQKPEVGDGHVGLLVELDVSVRRLGPGLHRLYHRY